MTSKKKMFNLDTDDQLFCSKLIQKINFIALIILIIACSSILVGLFIPVSVDKEFEILFTIKAMIIKVAGLAGILLFAVNLIARTLLLGHKTITYSLIKNPWNILLLFILVCGAIAINNAQYRVSSVLGHSYSYSGYLAFLSYSGIFMLGSLITKEKHKLILFKILTIFSLILAGLVLIKEGFNFDFIAFRGGRCLPYSGTFVNPNHYGYLLSAICTLSLCLSLFSKNKKDKTLYIISFAINSLVLALNQSFGPFIGICIALVFISVYLLIKNYRENWKKFFIIWTIFIIIFARFGGRLISYDVPHFFLDIKQMFNYIFNQESGVDVIEQLNSIDNSRLGVWTRAISLILDKPIFGYGPDMSSTAYFIKYSWVMVPHNQFLQVALEMGIPAGISYFVAVIWIIVRCFRKFKYMPDSTKTAAICMGAFAVSAFFAIILPIADFVFWMMLGLVNGWFHQQIDVNLIKGE